MQSLLDEIPDSLPADVRRDFLDSQAVLDMTAYMIACSCGFTGVDEMLADKGCNVKLINSSGKTGEMLALSIAHELAWSALRSWNRGDKLYLSANSVEAYLTIRTMCMNEHRQAGIQVWTSKQVVSHFNKEQVPFCTQSLKC